MSEQIILTRDEYISLLNFMKAPLRKEENGRSITIEDIFGIPLIISMVRGQKAKDREPEVIGTIIYGNQPHMIRGRKDNNGQSYVICTDYFNGRDSFEFIPVNDVQTYKIIKAYDLIKMGLVNLYGCTHSKEDVDSLFSLIKEMEKDDTENAGS